MTRYELIPNDSHKSFYGKAYVQVDGWGRETLYSYNTGQLHRLEVLDKDWEHLGDVFTYTA